MNNMDYLDQITGSVQGRGNSGGAKLFSPLMIKILVVGVILFVVLLVAGGMLGGMAAKGSDVAKKLDLRMTNLMKIEETYGKEVSRPRLRSIGNTFRGVMMDTTRDLGAYLAEKEDFDVNKPGDKLAGDEQEVADELTATLENARLNGVLDNTFAREMNLQIALILSMESEVAERTSDEELRGAMEDSAESLRNIQNDLNNL